MDSPTISNDARERLERAEGDFRRAARAHLLGRGDIDTVKAAQCRAVHRSRDRSGAWRRHEPIREGRSTLWGAQLPYRLGPIPFINLDKKGFK